MKPKLICDHCKEKLKKFMVERNEMVYVVDDGIGGLSVMDHYNHERKIILCEEGFNMMRQQLIDEECWMDLDQLDSSSCTTFFPKDYNHLVKELNKKVKEK